MKPNMHYTELKDTYLFNTIYRKTDEYLAAHPGEHVLKLGVGDVSYPLCKKVIEALHEAVDDQSRIETFHGYMPEHGAMFLREAIAKYYSGWNVDMTTDEVFVSSGACDDLGDLLEMFDRDNTVLVIEPAYPEYVDTNLLYGRKVIHLPAGEGDGFLPLPDESIDADIIYICSPNNPTGSAYTREKLKKWVDYANKKDAVILYDAAYEIFIEEDDVPHSIYEIEGADTCAVEVCSFSKTAGFTGTRVGYTIVPSKLERMGVNLNALWSRNRETRTNGISYILQKGASAVFTPEGQKQIYESISVYKKNAKVIMDALDKCGFWYVGGKNSPYVWMKCPNNMGSWEFFDYLLNELQIVGTPGVGFGSCGEGFLRLSAFGDPDDTKEAAKRIVEHFAK
ncbi:MAG: LL-diaminopimelate aminotransferase [Oscillospiraceae bacterium]|nr:LL-diaminopimelate aminotransferase [Ruminococcus sp.]MDY3088299.1 LL-diaminopimelate aminotransferase [Oscillospiraceae bacterium]